MKENLIIILIFVAIALLLGILILVINSLLPKEKEKSKKIVEILEIIPKRDCGACGYAGCEKYAQVIAENPEVALKDKCPFMIKDKAKLQQLEKILGIKLKMDKK
ncbi:MAG: hypothetical protein FJW69_04705 [Actinobacteria bacterium]|nr:hypothetical protein [Actinomycetota bacterium]MBM3712568.1 hypothetical protein [Actinomycetota bacterium]